MACRYSMPSMVAHGSQKSCLMIRRLLNAMCQGGHQPDDPHRSRLVAGLTGKRSQCLPGKPGGDAEACAHASAYLRRFEVDADTLALGPIDEVGPAGHFLAHKHTVQHFRKELWTKKLQDRFILDPGESSFADQAKQKVREILTGHKVPPLDRDR